MSILLPSNSSELEKTLEKVIDYKVDAVLLHGFKFKEIGSSLSLIWEYSLSKIRVENFADRIKQGFEFHGYKGTPYALKMAFSWHNFNDVIIEEEIPGEHFAEFQIGLSEIPNNLKVDTIIGIAKMASPLRSKLSRMYNSLYDVRRFILSESKFVDILSDNSGIRLRENDPKLSFGRENHYEIQLPEISEKSYNSREHYNFAKNIDVFRLSFGYLNDAPPDATNRKSTSFPERHVWNTDRIGKRLENLLQVSTRAKALVVLSESVYADINTCLSGGYEKIIEEPFIASFSKLSQHKVTAEQIPIIERFYREKLWIAVSPFMHSASACRRSREYAAVCCDMLCVIRSTQSRDTYQTAQYHGNNTWHDHVHFGVSWNQQNKYTRIT